MVLLCFSSFSSSSSYYLFTFSSCKIEETTTALLYTVFVLLLIWFIMLSVISLIHARLLFPFFLPFCCCERYPPRSLRVHLSFCLCQCIFCHREGGCPLLLSRMLFFAALLSTPFATESHCFTLLFSSSSRPCSLSFLLNPLSSLECSLSFVGFVASIHMHRDTVSILSPSRVTLSCLLFSVVFVFSFSLQAFYILLM